MINMILNKWDRKIPLTKEDTVTLLNVKNTSGDFYQIISKANEASRKRFHNKAYIFAQIGINSAPCSGNCRFCSLAKDTFTIGTEFEKEEKQVVTEAADIARQGIEALFLMTTADYNKSGFLSIGKGVRRAIGKDIHLVANIGDFDLAYAQELKSAGFSGVYHIVRLREGTDTDISKEKRIETLNAIKEAGLDLYYCVEPIGPEHTYEEIADEMIRARDYQVDVMAVMARVGVQGTLYENTGGLSEPELAKLAAVARLVTDPGKAMCVHEPRPVPLMAGVNQLYAEFGSNPRDNDSNTEESRGFDIDRIKEMLLGAEYTL